jgi:hypothetical protein
LRAICDPHLSQLLLYQPPVKEALLAIHAAFNDWIPTFLTVPAPHQRTRLESLTAFFKLMPTALSGASLPAVLDCFLPVITREIPLPIDLYRSVMRLLSAITEALYHSADFPFDPIGNATLSMIQSDAGEFAVAAMDFWFDIATIEKRMLRRLARHKLFLANAKSSRSLNENSVRAPPSLRIPSLSEGAARHIGRRLLEFLLQIDPQNTGEEDPSANLPHQRATVLLQTFFAVAPETVFAAVSEFWQFSFEFGDIRTLPWTEQHALLLSLACILRWRSDLPIRQFLDQLLPIPESPPLWLYAAAAITAPHPIIQETGLFVARLALRKYQMPSTPEGIDEIIGALRALLDSRPSPNLIGRIFGVAAEIMPAHRARQFERILELPLIALSRADAKETKISGDAHDFLRLLIGTCPDWSFPRIAQLFDGILHALTNEEQPDNVVTAQVLSLGACFRRFGDSFLEFGLPIGDLLFARLPTANSAIKEGILVSLVSLIRNSGRQLYSAERIPILMSFLRNSEQPRAIGPAISVLATFFKAFEPQECPQELIAQLPHIFDLIFQILRAQNLPAILCSLAFLVSHTTPWNTHENRLQLLGLYSAASRD